jgi:very-short-patch-repair endonuclease
MVSRFGRRPFRLNKPARQTKRINKSSAFWKKLAKTEPNNAEMTLYGIMCYLELPYRYTGNGQFILMGRAPDFVHRQKRKIVEMYGERWHDPAEEEERAKLFAMSDYQTLIVWQRELKPDNRKKLYRKLQEFELLA